MKIFSVLLNTIVVTTSVIATDKFTFDYSKWTKQDLIDFLHDHYHDDPEQIKAIPTKEVEDLRKDVASYLKKHDVDVSTEEVGEERDSAPSYFSKLKGHLKSLKEETPVSEWLFDTWTEEDLRQFLTENKIEFNKNAKDSRDQLVKKVKEHFQDASEKLDVSGYYPSDPYFKNWTVKDLKKWLQRFNIPYDKTIKEKNELLHLVRENIYEITGRLHDERVKLLDSLHVANKQIFDKAGKLKDDVFNSWSKDDLEKWLQSHEIDFIEKKDQTHDQLVKLAKKYPNYLKDDLEWYMAEHKKKSFPYISKEPISQLSIWQNAKNCIGNLFSRGRCKSGEVINDTFLVGIENWPRDRLKAFLNYRGIKYSMFSTNNELRQLARANRNKPLKDFEKYVKYPFGSLKEAKKWAMEKKIEIQDSDIYDAVASKMNSLTGEKPHIMKKGAETFDSWSQEDLVSYLKSFGNQNSVKNTKDDLVNLAKTYTQYFFNAEAPKPFHERCLDKVKNVARRYYVMFFKR